ncbi:MAG: leucine--tRNA ligase [Bacteroidota bacterium]|nr:leucine--tRNA ligase [Candidatus Kapabacteria bacterium]MCS7302483.1 leucine--tRNA ligase [Candidatus Kapabacteria bacterium]MCX7937260.1 leucine--tRNA ligase [Chlorobiota bacterium]MDW8075523.1 leucine--tRNA ligase [Bacteroidota bacterium]MDW8271799.1 leucine--tRNA ligase [Bacteroidota bacterium]
MAAYPFDRIEAKWQQFWDTHQTFATREDPSKPKFYVLDMFPYPSGAGLHIGHPEGYTATDIIARYMRMRGYNVLHPMGWDAFGLPTERYSMTTGIHPRTATANNIATFKRQLKMLGFSYDWTREIDTTDPRYYRWTQWMFRLIYNSWYDHEQQRARPIEELPIPSTVDNVEAYRDAHRLAYMALVPVNWCEELGTVLANEEVDEWREKGYTVERRPMRQWMIRITAYAERLLADLDLVDWPESTKEMQRNWIGKSEGAEITFPVIGTEESVTVFTTRPDTLFGATYLVLSPEHPLVPIITEPEYRDAVDAYITEAHRKTDLERTDLAREKTGVFTGAFALNPATKREIPIWIADYVLMHYGTGAIMAVPAHDQRDFEFATAYRLPIEIVVQPPTGALEEPLSHAYTDDGIAWNSSNDEVSLDGLPTPDAKKRILTWLQQRGIGRPAIRYKLRDWLFSRQRYWGEPIPILHFDDGTRRVLDEDELPLELPDVQDIKPTGTGESVLATVPAWMDVWDPKTGKHGHYETNTMPQWAGSCWYYLRFCDPHNTEHFADPNRLRYWLGTDPNRGGVDLYVGGAEHAVLHLLYARFWHKVLYDYGYVPTKEPFAKLFHQGLILGEDGRKMSKSLGNVINPDEIVRDYGADALRLFEMFLGPLEATKPWSSQGIEGIKRFLDRLWRMYTEPNGSLSRAIVDVPLTRDQARLLHRTIKKVQEDIEALSFNTAIAQMMIFVNEFSRLPERPREAMEKFVLLLAPFAPHIAEELWQLLGHPNSLAYEPFPTWDEELIHDEVVEIVLQVNSKVRAKIHVPADCNIDQLKQYALDSEDIQRFISGKTIKNVIVVPGKLVNIVVE